MDPCTRCSDDPPSCKVPEVDGGQWWSKLGLMIAHLTSTMCAAKPSKNRPKQDTLPWPASTAPETTEKKRSRRGEQQGCQRTSSAKKRALCCGCTGPSGAPPPPDDDDGAAPAGPGYGCCTGPLRPKADGPPMVAAGVLLGPPAAALAALRCVHGQEGSMHASGARHWHGHAGNVM